MTHASLSVITQFTPPHVLQRVYVFQHTFFEDLDAFRQCGLMEDFEKEADTTYNTAREQTYCRINRLRPQIKTLREFVVLIKMNGQENISNYFHIFFYNNYKSHVCVTVLVCSIKFE